MRASSTNQRSRSAVNGPRWNRVHDAVRTNHDRRRVGAGNAERGLDRTDAGLIGIRVPANRIGETPGLDEIAGILVDVGADADADDGGFFPGALRRIPKRLQLRHLGAARFTPRRPEIDDHDVAPQIGQPQRAAVEERQRDVRRGLTGHQP